LIPAAPTVQTMAGFCIRLQPDAVTTASAISAPVCKSLQRKSSTVQLSTLYPVYTKLRERSSCKRGISLEVDLLLDWRIQTNVAGSTRCDCEFLTSQINDEHTLTMALRCLHAYIVSLQCLTNLETHQILFFNIKLMKLTRCDTDDKKATRTRIDIAPA